MRPSRRSSWRCLLPLTSVLLALAGPAWAADGGVLSGSFDDDELADGGTAPDGGTPAARPSPSVARFDAALRLVAAGRERNAAEELARLAHERPDDDIAPEALFEAALLYEDQLAEPEKAQRLYRELCGRYPSSRLLRRAQGRLAELDAALRTGARPLVAFQAILRGTPEASTARRDRLAALLADSGDFALADQALFLLADTSLRLGDRPAAERYLDELYRRFPRSTWAAQGHRLQAETLLAARHIAAARRQYQALLAFPGPLWALVAREGQLACRRAERMLYAAGACWLYLLGVALVALYRGRRHLWPPPTEVFYYAPVAAFLAACAFLVQGGTVAAPIWQFGLAGSALSWLSAAAAQRTVARQRERSTGRRLLSLGLGLLGRGLAVTALIYLVVYHHSLLDIIVETVRNGPDTD